MKLIALLFAAFALHAQTPLTPVIDTIYDGAGQLVCLVVGEDDVLGSVRTTRVVLAAAHRNHDTSDNRGVNLIAVCQRCHMNHDRPEHKRRRWRTLFRRKAAGDLFGGPYT